MERLCGGCCEAPAEQLQAQTSAAWRALVLLGVLMAMGRAGLPRQAAMAPVPGVPAAEPAPEVVRFRFSPITADVAQESRVEEAPDTPIQGRFNSIARDEVVDDADTPVPASDITGPDNSIDGTGAEHEVAGDPLGTESATPEALAAASAAEVLTDGPALSPGARAAMFVAAGLLLTPVRSSVLLEGISWLDIGGAAILFGTAVVGRGRNGA